MQKCTLCVDRIYNDSFEEIDRQPACVMACPTRARHFGDLGDADSAVSKLVAAREGYDLMPEMGYKQVNKYLPPRPRRQIFVDWLVAHLRHQVVAFARGDEFRDRGIRIAQIAEVPRACRTGHHAG